MPKVIYFKFIYLYELITKSNSMYKHLITQWCSDIIGLRKVIIAGLWYSIYILYICLCLFCICYMYIYVFSVPLYMAYENKDDWLINWIPQSCNNYFSKSNYITTPYDWCLNKTCFCKLQMLWNVSASGGKGATARVMRSIKTWTPSY
jgi:hypothetical protein